MFSFEAIKETLDACTTPELQEVIDYCNDRIRQSKMAKAASLKQQIAELESQLDEIEPKPKKNGNGSRNYKGITNPNDPSQVYKTGPHPAWLTQMLKDELGDRYRKDKAEMARVIAHWKNGGAK